MENDPKPAIRRMRERASVMGAKDLVRLCTVALGESLRPSTELKTVTMKIGRLHCGYDITPSDNVRRGWTVRHGDTVIRFLTHDAVTAALVLSCELMNDVITNLQQKQSADFS